MVRRVIVTPTFAAGLGVVIAAVLAYPMSGAGIEYAAPAPPDNGVPCPASDCRTPEPGHGSLATMPGRRIWPHPSAHPTPAAQPSVTPGPGGGGEPVLSYETLHDFDGRFIAEFTIVPDAPIPARGWRLRFRYPSGQIMGVWGGRWRPQGPHAAVIEEWGFPGHHRLKRIHIFVAATGTAGPPSGCSFDRQPCRIEVTRTAAHQWPGFSAGHPGYGVPWR